MMAKQCKKCSTTITGIDIVICRGYCGGFFHLNDCSGVTRAMLSYMTSSKKNLFWMCDGCAELFTNSHFRAISCQADEKSPLTSLASAITELRTEIKQLHSQPTPHALPVASPRWPAADRQRGVKRPRVVEVNTRASESCRVGSKKPLDNVMPVPICIKQADQLFWLYLSRIRPDVTVDAICEMTKAYLNIENNPTVVKLVPKGKSIDSLSFVSFKIGLDPSLKSKALDPETWPEGLLFRQFENYGPAKFHLPAASNVLPAPLLLPQASPCPMTPVMEC